LKVSSAAFLNKIYIHKQLLASSGRRDFDDEDRDVLDEFCSAVLIAVAHLYRAEDNYTEAKQAKTEKIGNLSIPENDSMFGALLGIISNLGNIRGMLLGGDIRAEEPKNLN
jgi:hypothetical protein